MRAKHIFSACHHLSLVNHRSNHKIARYCMQFEIFGRMGNLDVKMVGGPKIVSNLRRGKLSGDISLHLLYFKRTRKRSSSNCTGNMVGT